MELTINSLIKLIIGIFVVTFVLIGFILFFKDYVSGLFDNFSAGTPLEMILGLVI
jgi:hypothetical protein